MSEPTDTVATIHRLVRAFAPTPVDGPLDECVLVDDLGYHSLALLELAFALEDEFTLPPMDHQQAQTIRTVAQVESYVLTTMAALRS